VRLREFGRKIKEGVQIGKHSRKLFGRRGRAEGQIACGSGVGDHGFIRCLVFG
jgi:hypothetical protein